MTKVFNQMLDTVDEMSIKICPAVTKSLCDHW